MKSLKITFILMLLLDVRASFAAGYLDHLRGTPYRWDNSQPITYLVDQGTLGSFTNEQARGFVSTALSQWTGVAIGEISFSNACPLTGETCPSGQLGEDVKGNSDPLLCPDANFVDYVTIDSLGAPRTVGNDTIVLFDSDGTIFDCLLGKNASSVVLGVASPGKLDDATMQITAGVAIINGKDATSNGVTSTMTHEFGHMLNLSHVQINYDMAANADTADDVNVPTMTPTLPADETAIISLNPDDEFSLGYLYPSASFDTRGFITGRITRRLGEGVRAVNVVCRDTADPLYNVVSWISDIQLAGEGQYICGNLSTGSYSVWMEPIELAINIYEPNPPFIISEYYNGASESFDPETDNREGSTSVAIAEGAATSGIDLVLNENGRLISGETITGTSNGYIPDLEYFISVPAGADRLKLELSTNSSADLDINGRCDGEFSLPFDSTAPPIAAGIDQSQQAEFSTSSLSGDETITLTGKSDPKLKACTYHLLITNLSSNTNADYSFTATIEGANPKLVVKKGPGSPVTGGSGEILTMSQQFEALDDTFRMRAVTVTDVGLGDLNSVVAATLYEDTDGDGAATAADRTIATAASIDPSTRKIGFTGLDEFFEPNAPRTLLVTYTVSTTAAAGDFVLLLALALFFGLPGKTRRLAFVALAIVSASNCGGDRSGYRPAIQDQADLTVKGMTFGDQFKLSIESATAASVKDFFD